MALKPYKFIVQAICQEVDDEGNVIGEVQTEPVTVFGVAQLTEWAVAFPDHLAAAEAQSAP